MTRTITPRNAPKMSEAVAFVAEHPGTMILPVAEEVGPHGSRQYGYRTVQRAIDAGLIIDSTPESHRYSLHLTAEGERFLESA